jgi:hypothetical protein
MILRTNRRAAIVSRASDFARWPVVAPKNGFFLEKKLSRPWRNAVLEWPDCALRANLDCFQSPEPEQQ